jgi:autotransporter-associated beta strand protein
VPASTAVQVGGGATFDLASFNDTIGSLSNGSSGAGNVNLGSGTLTTGGNNASTTFNGFFGTGSGGLTKVGTGTFNTGNAFLDYLGPTSILGGTLVSTGADPNRSAATAVTVAAGATWDLGGRTVIVGSLAGAGTVKNGGLDTGKNNQATTFSGVMQSVLSLEKFGTGTFTMTAANAYTGSILGVKQGILRMGGNNVVNGVQFVFVDPGATFDLNNFEAFIGSLFSSSFGVGGSVSLGNGILVVNPVVGSNDNFNGIISGSAASDLIKQGPDTLTLSGPNTYSGVTSIEGGTLRLGANNAVPSGSLAHV